jgi:hypothetical protein
MACRGLDRRGGDWDGEAVSEKLTGTFDNLSTMRREVWFEGRVYEWISALAIETVGSAEPHFGTYPKLHRIPSPNEHAEGPPPLKMRQP